MSFFHRYIGIDYSGAQTPLSRLTGLRVYVSEGLKEPVEIRPLSEHPRHHWSRNDMTAWLIAQLNQNIPTCVGIDHGFSFPLSYFEQYQIPENWEVFLCDFQQHWPTQAHTVESIRKGLVGNGLARSGNPRWRRLSERRSIKAKSVFHFDVPGSVAKSSHAGLPWLLHMRQSLGQRVHFWPFDGWAIPAGMSVITEAYPSLWNKIFDMAERTQDQHDAFSIAAMMSQLDQQALLLPLFSPNLTESEKATAGIEGWILGV